MSSRLLRLETFAFLSLVLVGSLLPIIIFETVRDVSEPQSVLFQDYSALFRSFVVDNPFDGDDDDYLPEDEEIFTILKNRKELESSQLFSLATPWRRTFMSPQCQVLMQSGAAASQTVAGMGARPGCIDSTVRESKHAPYQLTSTQATVHISVSHRVIYVPSISMFRMREFFGFEKAIKRRFHTRQVPERLLPLFFKHLQLNASDFFVFTFVQHPLTHFVANYNLLKVNATGENFISSASAALNELDQAKSALSPKQRDENTILMFNQVFKTMRCIPTAPVKKYKHQLRAEKRVLDFDFVGKLENLQDDWRYIEAVLGVSNVPLRWEGGLATLRNVNHKRNKQFDFITEDIFNFTQASAAKWQQQPLRMLEDVDTVETVEKVVETVEPAEPEDEQSVLERKRLKDAVCEYYKSDFTCFGYDRAMCDDE